MNFLVKKVNRLDQHIIIYKNPEKFRLRQQASLVSDISEIARFFNFR